MNSVLGYCTFSAVGSPIRRSPDQRLFAASRSFSQLTTSFIAFRRQGIHRVPFGARSIFSVSGPPSGSLRYTAYAASFTTGRYPHTRIRRVCPSIFNCQRPQMLHSNCNVRRNDTQKSATKKHKIHKRLLCVFCAFLWLIPLPKWR
jgi:hypothetical protein